MKQHDSLRKTFWELLGGFVIEIPQIQRDYAQGRDSALDLRNRFLDRILLSLKDPGKVLRLDFIYGDTFMLNSRRAFHPLDGQQRLTTLWLLHWYVAYRAGVLKKMKETFHCFRYMVRGSSDAFLSFLCEFDTACATGDICKTIREQTEFYAVWHQDPTVVSILNMLDSMEDKFAAVTDFSNIWTILSDSSKCPIFFFLLPLKSIGHTDDLYIKMNARGKPLSGYENFKADLIKEIRDNGWGEKLEYSRLLDGKWTDVFWKNRLSGTSQIDEIYFAFITRYLAHVYICEGKTGGGGNITEDFVEKDKPVEWRLYQESAIERGEKRDGKYRFEYTSYEPYRSLINENELIRLKYLFENVTLFTFIPPSWEEKNPLDFIPKYEDADHITTLTMKQRLVFHGICCYLRIPGFDKKEFSQWMRVVWNLSENLNTENTLSGLMGALRTINELGEHSHGIYEWLKLDESLNNDYGRAQVFEEREKARRILDGGSDWEEKIISAERDYNGAIRFLFLDEESKVNWDYFDQKRRNLLNILSPKGVADKYKENAILLRTLLSYCNCWEKQMESWSNHYRYIYGYEYDLWRNNILLRVDDTQKNSVVLLYASPVHHILMNHGLNPYPGLKDDSNPGHLKAYDTLVNTDILVGFNGPRYYVRSYRSKLCLYPSSEGVMLTMVERDEVLTSLVHKGIISLTRGRIHCVMGRYVIDGWKVIFNYRNYDFIWYIDNGSSLVRIKTDSGDFDYGNQTRSGFAWKDGRFNEFQFVAKLDQAISQLESLAEAAERQIEAETMSQESIEE